MKPILVATDGSESADRAVDNAARVAKVEAADLQIVNVIGGYGLPHTMLARFTESERKWLADLLASLSAQSLTTARARACATGARAVTFESRPGDVAETIIAVAREKAKAQCRRIALLRTNQPIAQTSAAAISRGKSSVLAALAITI